MIKVLPEWGYDSVQREHFLTMFTRMLKSINAAYLVHNERREVSTMQARPHIDTTHPNPTEHTRFFSPSRDRQAAAQARYGDDHAARVGVATYPPTEAQQARVAIGTNPPTVGPPYLRERGTPLQPAGSPTSGSLAFPSHHAMRGRHQHAHEALHSRPPDQASGAPTMQTVCRTGRSGNRSGRAGPRPCTVGPWPVKWTPNCFSGVWLDPPN